MTSTTPRGALPSELVLYIWWLHAALKHDEACPRGSLCLDPELCPEARSPDPAVALVSKHWRKLAALNPELWSFIHVAINPHYSTRLNVESTKIPIDNEHDVKACAALSGSEDIHLSIGTSTSQVAHDITQAAELSLAGLAARACSLVLDVDNPQLVFMVANVSFPRLNYIHIDHGRQDYGYDNNTGLVERFLLWRDSPIERIVCGHKMSAIVRTKISWSALTLLDLHGIHLGFKDAHVESILSLGVNLQELRVVIYEHSTTPDIPPMPQNIAKRASAGFVHDRLKTLFIKHDISGDESLGPPSYRLFKGMEFSVLQDLYYSCTGYPHDNSIDWLKESRPTVKSLSLDVRYISPKRFSSILSSLDHLETLRLKAPSICKRSYDCIPFDNLALNALRRASPDLKTLSLAGEGSFTIEEMTHFVEARQPVLHTILLREWWGPSVKQVHSMQSTLHPVALKVGKAVACVTTGEKGTRTKRQMTTIYHEGKDHHEGGSPPVYWCIPCRGDHCPEPVDAEALDVPYPLMKERNREFYPR